jgi:hypothetical protein
MSDKLDLAAIEKQLVTTEMGWQVEDLEESLSDIKALLAEVKRLRTDRDACIAGLKELKDNALISMRSYPMHSEGWFDFSHRAQAYENAYIRATNMLNWDGSGMSFVHFTDLHTK